MNNLNLNLQKFNKIKSFLPKPNGKIDWLGLYETEFKSFFQKMLDTPQNSEYHAEGNVFNHVKGVTESIITLPEYENGSELDRLTLFLASLLHDVGKIKRTRLEEGKIVSPKHAVVGSNMAREFLWKELGLVGNDTLRNLRESVCFLVKYHSFPPYAVLEENPLHKSLKIASNGELASLFTIEKLCALARADVYGRISKSNNEYLNRIEFLTLLAKEQGFYTTPFAFANAYTERGYFLGKTAWQNDVLYNNSYGEVIIVAGLPGTGKDTFIKNNYPTLPVVSLDEIRVRMGVLPTDNQGIVIQTAKEESKQYLRKKQSFVFNATNITYDVRSKYVSLFEEYNAFVKIVFLEAPYEVELLRNSGRENVVPVTAIDKMLSKLEMVERWESGDVCWF